MNKKIQKWFTNVSNISIWKKYSITPTYYIKMLQLFLGFALGSSALIVLEFLLGEEIEALLVSNVGLICVIFGAGIFIAILTFLLDIPKINIEFTNPSELTDKDKKALKGNYKILYSSENDNMLIVLTSTKEYFHEILDGGTEDGEDRK